MEKIEVKDFSVSDFNAALSFEGCEKILDSLQVTETESLREVINRKKMEASIGSVTKASFLYFHRTYGGKNKDGLSATCSHNLIVVGGTCVGKNKDIIEMVQELASPLSCIVKNSGYFYRDPKTTAPSGILIPVLPKGIPEEEGMKIFLQQEEKEFFYFVASTDVGVLH